MLSIARESQSERQHLGTKLHLYLLIPGLALEENTITCPQTNEASHFVSREWARHVGVRLSSSWWAKQRNWGSEMPMPAPHAPWLLPFSLFKCFSQSVLEPPLAKSGLDGHWEPTVLWSKETCQKNVQIRRPGEYPQIWEDKIEAPAMHWELPGSLHQFSNNLHVIQPAFSQNQSYLPFIS